MSIQTYRYDGLIATVPFFPGELELAGRSSTNLTTGDSLKSVSRETLKLFELLFPEITSKSVDVGELHAGNSEIFLRFLFKRLAYSSGEHVIVVTIVGNYSAGY